MPGKMGIKEQSYEKTGRFSYFHERMTLNFSQHIISSGGKFHRKRQSSI
jgi:hypothetical protein